MTLTMDLVFALVITAARVVAVFGIVRCSTQRVSRLEASVIVLCAAAVFMPIAFRVFP